MGVDTGDMGDGSTHDLYCYIIIILLPYSLYQ